jgi:hypothetical protein
MRKKDLDMKIHFVESMQLQAFREWVGDHKQMWHVLWLRIPFRNKTLALKLLKQAMMVQ